MRLRGDRKVLSIVETTNLQTRKQVKKLRGWMKLGIVALTAIIGVAFSSVIERANIWFSTSSPNKTYRVELLGDQSRKFLPFSDQYVKFNLYKNGYSVSAFQELTILGWSENGFLYKYPEYEWVGERMLRFRDWAAVSRESKDSILILNRSTRKVKYVVIDALDLFLVLDIDANSTLELKAPRYGWNSWITGQGEFADGQPIPFNGVNFHHRDKIEGSLQYCISIDDSGLNIAGPMLEGSSYDKPNIPEMAACK